MAKQYLCTSCLTKGDPKTVAKGSILVEFGMWCFFIVPGIIYSFWRLGSKYKACRACGSAEIIPTDSPRAQQIMKGGV